ncbi:MAG: hypothetical protein N838_18705 [Thiohalocapsa sp. PB-PSB1]|jgi:hypothetical protein|nr:MAG: hypothetical protein N838_22080 [Thiohalocapsa sp. PB-PSB1]QQO55070.1 MAG: hypothetical protein N838_18705 [Thiohalocapsa sp. PB-PSB1]
MNEPIILCVHGLRNKPSPENLRALWEEAIVDGLQRNERRTAGQTAPAIDIAYWADVLYPEPDEDRKYPSCDTNCTLARYDDGFWDDLRADAQDLVGPAVETAKRWLGIDSGAEAFLKRVFNDLHRYYTEDDTRAEVRERLREKILQYRTRRIMVIGHSMGSIVAYDVLRRLGRQFTDLSIDHFVTIGSPLGLPHVKVKIFEENDLVRTPSLVRRWTNFSERRDPVAFDTHLAREFAANDRGIRVEDDLVLNTSVTGEDGSIDYHSSIGYLRTPEVSAIIRSFI